jgi:hypothetical protein
MQGYRCLLPCSFSPPQGSRDTTNSVADLHSGGG